MKLIISGTNRRESRTLQVAKLIQSFYQDSGETTELLDLSTLPYDQLTGEDYPGPGKTPPPAWATAVNTVTQSEAIIFVVPEYNGSFPGALKYFLDHWKYPETFEARPVCFVGLGGTFGGLRPVEHLQQVMNYRNAYVFPQRVFLFNIWNVLKDGQLTDANMMTLLKNQVVGFQKFIKALKSQNLDAQSLQTVQKTT